MNPTLRRRSQRLLAAYPSDWRAANAEVVLGTLLEPPATAGAGRRCGRRPRCWRAAC